MIGELRMELGQDGNGYGSINRLHQGFFFLSDRKEGRKGFVRLGVFGHRRSPSHFND